VSGARRKRKEVLARRLSAALAMLFFVGLGVAGVLGVRYLTDPARLPLRTIRVEDHFRHLDRAELQRALTAAVDGGFFGVDLEKVRQAALRLPWVAGARVTRIWPDRLQVEIVEQVPVARWNDGGLVNGNGEVFYPKGGKGLALPLRFRGPEGKAAQMLAFYRDVQPGFRRRNLEIRELMLDRRGEWRLKLDDGLLVVVGREQQQYRIERLLDAYAVLGQAGRNLRRIDLRYEQGFAVAWRPEEKG